MEDIDTLVEKVFRCLSFSNHKTKLVALLHELLELRKRPTYEQIRRQIKAEDDPSFGY